jgi:predicted component of type VI protein secretion system
MLLRVDQNSVGYLSYFGDSIALDDFEPDVRATRIAELKAILDILKNASNQPRYQNEAFHNHLQRAIWK